MDRKSRLKRNGGVLALASLVAVLAAWVLAGGASNRAALGAGGQSPFLRRPTGQPQLVSVEPLPESDGEMCQWETASATTTLTSLLEERAARPADVPPPGTSVNADRLPVRTIRDPYPSFSAIAVEPKSNMLVVTDENLFQVMEYNRMDNTPPNAKMTEPKRVVGGTLTKAEMMCGVYIDPVTLDTYIVNNDTQDWLAIFAKTSKGNAAPDRSLAVPHGTFGIAVDEVKQELFLTVQHNNEVIVYRKMAEGQEAPLRELFGDETRLEDPHGIAVDAKDNLLFVSNHGNVSYRAKDSRPNNRRGYMPGSGKFAPPSITIYARDAQGNTAPLRTISGPKTGLNWPMTMTVDEERGELYVANDMAQSIVVYRVTDDGDVAPTRIIKGPKTEIKNPTGVALDLKNKELWVANMGNHRATVFPMTANGDVPPLRTIRGGPTNELSLMIGNPGAVGYDGKREQILVPN